MTEAMLRQLREMQPEHEFFIGIDSDGCVFDSMEIKQNECFIPNIVKHFGLQNVSRYVRETAGFVNLSSQWRGSNRFPALLQTMDFLRERPEVHARGVKVPELNALRRWMAEENKLGNPALEARVAATGDAELKQILDWSLAVNEDVTDMVKGLGPLPGVREVLAKAAPQADMLVVSQTPLEALEREWDEHDMRKYLRVICGQEHGTKIEHLQHAAGGKYAEGRMLMIGDALGDKRAAEAVGALFYPINPRGEEASWARLRDEALDRFFEGRFAGDYQQALIEEFVQLLPDTPPWKT